MELLRRHTAQLPLEVEQREFNSGGGAREGGSCRSRGRSGKGAWGAEPQVHLTLLPGGKRGV